jgi:hypothetical protein
MDDCDVVDDIDMTIVKVIIKRKDNFPIVSMVKIWFVILLCNVATPYILMYS